MTLEEQVLEKLRQLPPDRQREVLAFVSHLRERLSNKPTSSLLGLWSGLGIDVSGTDIERARREMWRGFPRDVS